MTSAGDDARAYARLRYRLLLLDLVVWFAFLLAVSGSGLARALADWWSSRVGSRPLVLLGSLAILGTLCYALTFPLRMYAGFYLEHRFGLGRGTIRQWVGREAKRAAMSAVLGAVFMEGLYGLFWYAPAHWPLWATLGWVGVSVGLTRALPTVILPLFYQTAPLENGALKERLLTLCRRVGLPVLDAFRIELGVETRKANAALVGLGRSRRILLSDTLLSAFPADEIEGVLTHELAHHRFRHLPKALILSAVGTWVALALTDFFWDAWAQPLRLAGLGDVAGWPLLIAWLTLLSLAGLPIQNAISRAFEWQSDRFAVAMTGGASFAGALRRLADLNLADPSPPRWIVWWFFDHPPIAQRIHAAEAAQ